MKHYHDDIRKHLPKVEIQLKPDGVWILWPPNVPGVYFGEINAYRKDDVYEVLGLRFTAIKFTTVYDAAVDNLT